LEIATVTYFITALTNDKARNIVSRTQTTDATVAALVAAEYQRRGLLVRQWQEG
jgi:hypothetical protein